MQTKPGQSDIGWDPAPDATAVGTRPTVTGIELMVKVGAAPALCLPLSRREGRALRQALAQAIRDSEAGRVVV